MGPSTSTPVWARCPRRWYPRWPSMTMPPAEIADSRAARSRARPPSSAPTTASRARRRSSSVIPSCARRVAVAAITRGAISSSIQPMSSAATTCKRAPHRPGPDDVAGVEGRAHLVIREPVTAETDRPPCAREVLSLHRQHGADDLAGRRRLPRRDPLGGQAHRGQPSAICRERRGGHAPVSPPGTSTANPEATCDLRVVGGSTATRSPRSMPSGQSLTSSCSEMPTAAPGSAPGAPITDGHLEPDARSVESGRRSFLGRRGGSIARQPRCRRCPRQRGTLRRSRAPRGDLRSGPAGHRWPRSRGSPQAEGATSLPRAALPPLAVDPGTARARVP